MHISNTHSHTHIYIHIHIYVYIYRCFTIIFVLFFLFPRKSNEHCERVYDGELPSSTCSCSSACEIDKFVFYGGI